MESLISFIEILAMFLIHNILFNNNILTGSRVKIIFSIISIYVYFTFINFYKLDHMTSLFIIIFLNCLLISKIEKKNNLLLLSELIFCTIIIGLFELIITFSIQIFDYGRLIEARVYLIILLLGILFLIISLNYFLKKKKINFNDLFYQSSVVNIFVLNLFVLFMFIKLIMGNITFKSSFIIQAVLLIVLIMSINLYFLKYLLKADRENKKREIQEFINPVIYELMEKLKSTEHEYKNYLTTISGIAQVASPEKMGFEIENYIDNISSNNKNLSKILYIDNIIVKAIIYNMIERCNNLDIKFNYNISSKLENISLDEAELTIVLTNLLNNAFEAVSYIKDRKIDLIIYEELNNCIIDIKNTTENFNTETLQSIFKVGYSTKGKDRGYGLGNVKKIISKNNGKIHFSLERDNLNLIVFLPKKT